ncbi:plasmid pRiA4b ORF-3 family protein [Salmonella enterica]|nr:plasmid pRiA4b ORF-3 family protein [Salmonella enterica]EEH7223334.1 plasmid pRiA4b ORF-3 family protein [Salmonella enterica subsp. enterica]
MKVYVIKIAVRGVSPMVWRRLRIAADTSLAALHFIIQIIQGWGDDHLHQFHIYGKDYGITYDGGIGFPDNPFQSRGVRLRIACDHAGLGVSTYYKLRNQMKNQ